jgi:hypothetical protein
MQSFLEHWRVVLPIDNTIKLIFFGPSVYLTDQFDWHILQVPVSNWRLVRGVNVTSTQNETYLAFCDDGNQDVLLALNCVNEHCSARHGFSPLRKER